MLPIKPFEILLANFFTIEKTLPIQMVTGYFTRSTVIHLALTSTFVAGICKSLNLIVYKATAASIWWLRTSVAHLAFTTPNENLLRSTPTNQESLLLRPVKTKHGLAPRLHNSLFDYFEKKPAPLQD